MLPQPAKAQFSQDEYKQPLLDAEALLKYAAETGKLADKDKDTENAVLAARTAFDAKSLDAATTSALLSALATLANLVAPVTAESLRAFAKEARQRPPYRNWAAVLAVIIVIYSTISFVSSTIAASIQADITKANDLAVKLGSEFPGPAVCPSGATTGGPYNACVGTQPAASASTQTTSANSTPPTTSGGTPSATGAAQPNSTSARQPGATASTRSGTTGTRAGVGTALSKPPASGSNPAPAPPKLPDGLNLKEVHTDFQDYAATIRSIDYRTRQLAFFVRPNQWLKKLIFNTALADPGGWQKYQLQVPLVDYAGAATKLTREFQQVRYDATNEAANVSLFYGAVSSCILPVLYALLGAFAYILRTYQQQVRNRTYVPSCADSSRFVVAAIGGAVVGLFNNFTNGQTVKISPLALAFLVGYAVDVFYTFLENLIQSFSKTALGQGQAQPQSSVGKPAVVQVQAQTPETDAEKKSGTGTGGDAVKTASAGG